MRGETGQPCPVEFGRHAAARNIRTNTPIIAFAHAERRQGLMNPRNSAGFEQVGRGIRAGSQRKADRHWWAATMRTSTRIGARGTDAGDLAIFDRAQQAFLRPHRQACRFHQETMSRDPPPRSGPTARLGGTGEGARLVAETARPSIRVSGSAAQFIVTSGSSQRDERRVEAFGNQFLARPALADHQHRTVHRCGTAGPFDPASRKGARLADELAFPAPMANLYVKFPQCLAIDTNQRSRKTREKSPISANSGVWHSRCNITGRTTEHHLGRPRHERPQTRRQSFWSTKLGQAAMAALPAMVMMIAAVPLQIQPGAANAAPICPPRCGQWRHDRDSPEDGRSQQSPRAGAPPPRGTSPPPMLAVTRAPHATTRAATLRPTMQPAAFRGLTRKSGEALRRSPTPTQSQRPHQCRRRTRVAAQDQRNSFSSMECLQWAFSAAPRYHRRQFQRHVDKADDPTKMIRMIQSSEMEETLVEVRASAARTIADQKEMHRHCVKLDKLAGRLGPKRRSSRCQRTARISPRGRRWVEKKIGRRNGRPSQGGNRGGSYDSRCAPMRTSSRSCSTACAKPRSRQTAIAARLESARKSASSCSERA